MVWLASTKQFPGRATQPAGRQTIRGSMHRRAFLTAGSFALAATAAPAWAQQLAETGSQAEWSQNYDSASRIRVRRSSTPTLSAQAAQAAERAIEQYRDIVARGGWAPCRSADHARRRPRPGRRDLAPAPHHDRRSRSGRRLPRRSTIPMSRRACAASRRATASPRAGPSTRRPSPPSTCRPQLRLRQLEINLVRLRAYSGNLGQRFVIVNIPAALVETVEDGQVVTRHAAGVGKIDRQSPVMNAKIIEMNFNPFWTVPASIIRKDLIPKMQEEPEYLTRNKIRIFNGGGQELSPRQVNWYSDEATRYMFKQDPGGDVNSHGLRAHQHSQPARRLHARHALQGHLRRRFPLRLLGLRARAERARLHPAGSSRTPPAGIASRSTRPSRAGSASTPASPTPVAVYWIYITAWATADGIVQFRDDIYNRDGLGGVPVASRMQGAPEPDSEDLLN